MTADDVVLEEIHSEGLLRDIEGSQKVVLAGVGHKPDYLGLNEIVAAIENISTRSLILRCPIVHHLKYRQCAACWWSLVF